MKEKNVSHEVEKTMSLSQNISEVAPPDFFYTRLRARMDKELVLSPQVNWLLRPALIIPTLVLVVAMNIYTVVNLKELPSTENAFSQSYNLNTADDLNLY